MSLYVYELAPWERKSEYYHVVELGKNSKEQTILISKQTKAFIDSQLSATNSIIDSNSRIQSSIDNINNTISEGFAAGFDRVEQGIYGLKSCFEWGIAEICWQIEQNRNELKNILEILQAPLTTQAKERRKRAEEAFSYGWIDDAEDEFLESEKLNKYDFSIHISLGIIYLFHKIDKEKAASYFDKAIKYAKPKSNYYTSYALLHKALIKFDCGQIVEAEKYSDEAIRLSPDFSEAFYQNSQYNAQLKNTNKSINHLEKAINIDKFYMVKASNDSLFNPIKKDINDFFKKMRDNEIHYCINKVKEIDSYVKKIKTLSGKIVLQVREKIEIFSFKSENINYLLSLNSYFDAVEAKNDLKQWVKTSQRYQKKCISSLEEKMKKIETNLSKERDERYYCRNKHQEEQNESTETIKKVIIVFCCILGVILFFNLANNVFILLDAFYSNYRKLHGFSFFDSFFLGFVIPCGAWLGTILGGVRLSYYVGEKISGIVKSKKIELPISKTEHELSTDRENLKTILLEFNQISPLNFKNNYIS